MHDHMSFEGLLCMYLHSGGPDEAHGWTYKADERDSERSKDPEVLCLGESIRGASSGFQGEGTEGIEEITDPLFHLHRFLQLLHVHGTSQKMLFLCCNEAKQFSALLPSFPGAEYQYRGHASFNRSDRYRPRIHTCYTETDKKEATSFF